MLAFCVHQDKIDAFSLITSQKFLLVSNKPTSLQYMNSYITSHNQNLEAMHQRAHKRSAFTKTKFERPPKKRPKDQNAVKIRTPPLSDFIT